MSDIGLGIGQVLSKDPKEFNPAVYQTVQHLGKHEAVFFRKLLHSPGLFEFFPEDTDLPPFDTRERHWARRPCHKPPGHYSGLSRGSPRRIQSPHCPGASGRLAQLRTLLTPQVCSVIPRVYISMAGFTEARCRAVWRIVSASRPVISAARSGGYSITFFSSSSKPVQQDFT